MFEIPSNPVVVNAKEEEKPCPHPNECVRPAGCTGDCMKKTPEKESQPTSETYGDLATPEQAIDEAFPDVTAQAMGQLCVAENGCFTKTRCAELGCLAIGVTSDLVALQLLEVCDRP